MKSYAKRECVSNWDKYEIDENLSESLNGLSFNELLDASKLYLNAYRNNKTGTIFDENTIFNQSKQTKVLSLNLEKLNDAFVKLPYDDWFIKNELKNFKSYYCVDELKEEFHSAVDETVIPASPLAKIINTKELSEIEQLIESHKGQPSKTEDKIVESATKISETTGSIDDWLNDVLED